VTPQDLALPTVGRWLGLVALAIVIGGFALELLVLPRDAADLTTARRRLRRWMALAVAVLVVASVGDLVARARVMSGGSLLEAMAALPLVLTRTHFGTIWIARALALVLLVMVSGSRAVTSRATGLVLSLAVALSLSLTGHAADWGDYSFSVLVDWLHAVAATSWTGGLFGLALTMCRDRPAWPTELVGVVARRFSQLAGYCLLVVVASGVYNSLVQVPSFAALRTTTYGVTLLLKIGLSLVLALLGAINRYRVLPGLNAGGEVTDRLSRLVTREAVLAVVVFGCTAVLAESTPKSHEDHMPHGATGTGRTESTQAAQE
jgi:copper resistance protein D